LQLSSSSLALQTAATTSQAGLSFRIVWITDQHQVGFIGSDKTDVHGFSFN
jgi:hypothetical protein